MANSDRLIQLVRQIKQGNELAFETIFFESYEELCKCAWKYVRSMDEAKGIVQDVFAEVWENRKKLDTKKNFRGYMFSMTKNKSLNYIKHQKVVENNKKEVSARQEIWRQAVDKHNDQSCPSLLNNDIKKTVEELSPKIKQTFLLNRAEGLTYKEIAIYLDISVKTVEYRMSKALNLLRARLTRKNIYG